MMTKNNNTVRVAVAGNGKTYWIAENITQEPDAARTLGLTFTTNAQDVLSGMINANVGISRRPLVMGWHSFLLNEIVRPYSPALFPRKRTLGYIWVNAGSNYNRGPDYYYYHNHSGDVYSDRLSLFANKVINASDGAAMERLRDAYDSIYIDEFQDLGGNDLDVLEALLTNGPRIVIVGDPRQATVTTSQTDQKYKKYDGPKIIDWLRMEQNKGNCEISYSQTSKRCEQRILDFADLIHERSLGFPASFSEQHEKNIPDSERGLYLVSKSELIQYYESQKEKPTILRNSVSAKFPEEIKHCELLNFRPSKGLTRNSVMIMSTNPIRKLILGEDELSTSSACNFYVAVTRARYKVAVVVPDADKFHAKLKRSSSRFKKLPFCVWHSR